MALTADELAELAQAKADLAALRGGRGVKAVQTRDRRVEYSPGDAAAVERRIAELEGRASSCRRRGAIGFRV